MIADSGERREFETGAVRDMAEGKGRCDLMPLDVVAAVMGDMVILAISNFQIYGSRENLIYAMNQFIYENYDDNTYEAMLDVSKHLKKVRKSMANITGKKDCRNTAISILLYGIT